MKKKPMIIWVDVPSARRRRKEDASPGKKCAMVEKRNADRPKPDMTIPVVEARYAMRKVSIKYIQAAAGDAHCFIGEGLCSCVDCT